MAKKRRKRRKRRSTGQTQYRQLKRRGRQQQRRQRRSQGSWPAYLASTLGGLSASAGPTSGLGWGASLALGSFASNSSDAQLRSVGLGLLTGAGVAFALPFSLLVAGYTTQQIAEILG